MADYYRLALTNLGNQEYLLIIFSYLGCINLFQIDIDYEFLYPESTINLHLKWFPFMEHLISLKKNSIKDKTALHYLELLEIENSEGK